jgi:hypothetical protein
MSRFLPYTKRIDPGIRYDRPSLEQAIEENYFEIIMGGLARRDYLTAVFETSDLRELPHGHLRDHRVTVPESIRLETEGDVRRLLRHMLAATGDEETIAISAENTGLDPEADAASLFQTSSLCPTFFEACARGDLHGAISIARRENRAGLKLETALELVGKMLVYFGVLEVQLVAAMIWSCNNPPIRLEDSGKYYVRTFVRDCSSLARTAIKSLVASDANAKLGPRERIAKDLRPRAAEAEARGSPSSMAADLIASGPYMRDIARQVLTAAKAAKGRGTGVSFYKKMMGVEPLTGLAFAAARLIQLVYVREALVDSIARGRLAEPISVEDHWPKATDPRVAAILFLYRLTVMEDDDGAIAVDGSGQLSVSTRLSQAQGQTKEAGWEILRKLRRKLRSNPFERGELRQTLRGAQRFDVLPDYHLSSSALHLHTAVKAMKEAQRAQRPANIRRAPRRSARPGG